MSPKAPLLQVSGLTKSFGSGENVQQVLKGVDLILDQRALVALQGRSGSGKSTFLSILGTLMRPTSGRHEMLGTDLINISERDVAEFRNRHIGFVFQFHHLLPDFSAVENVIFPAAVEAGRETGKARRRAQDLLKLVGLADRTGFRPSALSGGQRQRVAIARALMNAPELVLADEPTGNLDREAADLVMALIHEINANEATAFLISTHDEKVAAGCTFQIHLNDGRLANRDGRNGPMNR